MYPSEFGRRDTFLVTALIRQAGVYGIRWALGRRVRKVLENGGLTGDIANGTTDYLYTRTQCIGDP